ncbi:MAG: ABC transporter ATP-binding protein [Candidatus Geothermincolia bacterium]
MGNKAVTLEHIEKTYRISGSRQKKAAVADLCLDVEYGEIFGLLGPNGAGKTTTLKVMLGLVFPQGGTGTLLGKRLGDRAAHNRLGFLPEQSYFYSFLTAEKGLALYGRFFNLDRASQKKKSAELLDLVGLPRDSHLTLDKYSKGMLQRFGIAQALINDPELVILDEPSSGLDPVGQKEVRDILLDLKEQGKTIFLSSHQLSEVENICDSVSIMNGGRSAKEGKLSDLLTAKGLTRIVLRGNEPPAESFPEAKSVDHDNGLTTLEVESEDTYAALEAARSLGLEIVSVEPFRRSLEDIFLETIQETSS